MVAAHLHRNEEDDEQPQDSTNESQNYSSRFHICRGLTARAAGPRQVSRAQCECAGRRIDRGLRVVTHASRGRQISLGAHDLRIGAEPFLVRFENRVERILRCNYELSR